MCKFNRHEVAAYQGNKLLENTEYYGFILNMIGAPSLHGHDSQSWLRTLLEKLEVLDVKKMVATGHSRGGKTALCAGIYDERIAITAPNSSEQVEQPLRYFEKGQARQRLDAHQKKFLWWQNRYFDF